MQECWTKNCYQPVGHVVAGNLKINKTLEFGLLSLNDLNTVSYHRYIIPNVVNKFLEIYTILF